MTPDLLTLAFAEALRPLVQAEVAAAFAAHVAAQPAPVDVRSTCSVAEAAAELGTTPRNIRRWISTGRLRASRAVMAGSSRVRITRASVDGMRRGAT